MPIVWAVTLYTASNTLFFLVVYIQTNCSWWNCAGWQDFCFLQEIVHFLTRVAFARSLAPSQTGSSISVWSARLPARWQRRRWESAAFPWRGTGGGRVSASRQSTGRPPPREIRSSDSTGRRLQGRHTEPHCQPTTQPQPAHSHTPVHQHKTHTHTPPPTWLSVHRHNKTIATGHQVSHLWECDRRAGSLFDQHTLHMTHIPSGSKQQLTEAKCSAISFHWSGGSHFKKRFLVQTSLMHLIKVVVSCQLKKKLCERLAIWQ